MQTSSSQFLQYAIGQVRPITWGVRASFDKSFDSSVTFFTLDQSVLDGPDLLVGDDNVIQDWDKYAYSDYSDKVISLEVTKEEQDPYSVTKAYSDIVLNNYDKYFTPGSGSPIDQYILPRRPFKVSMGFGIEALPQIVGLSEKMPEVDKVSRTATFHIADFLSYLYDQDISSTTILLDKRTDEILASLLAMMGVSTDQYQLDRGFNKVKFFYVEKGDKFGHIADQLIEAEMGSLYMSETGVVTFKNCLNFDSTIRYTFDDSNTQNFTTSDESSIINSVKITADIPEVQDLQSVWVSSENILLLPGESVDVWADLQDPVTDLNNPSYSATPILDSYFTSTLDESGQDPYVGIVLSSMTTFSKAALMTFTNSGGSTAYLHEIDLWGTPAKVVNTLKVLDNDADSVLKFEERVYEIDNPYIQTQDVAETIITLMLRIYSAYASIVNLEVKGNTALQVGDCVMLQLDGIEGKHNIKKITNIIEGGKLTQRIRVRLTPSYTFFILDQSILDGPDVLGA